MLKDSLSLNTPPYNLISSEYEFLRIAGANNWFSQSINLLYTILIWDEKCEYTLPDDGNLDLKKIKENSSFLKKIRNQSVDHKHLAIEQPTWWLHNTVNTIYISKTREILEEVKLYLLHEYKSWIDQVTKKNILDWFESIIRLSNLTTNP